MFSFFAEFRTKEIQAKASAANDDILRCRLFVPISRRPAATKRTENSATIGMDARGSNVAADGVWVSLHENADLQEEGPHRMLEGGDRTVGT